MRKSQAGTADGKPAYKISIFLKKRVLIACFLKLMWYYKYYQTADGDNPYERRNRLCKIETGSQVRGAASCSA
ncbi:MAG: hypothetical protein J5944_02980, partial [Lentisphaeria bacterium]|nr:hypothetical protein [Lentisphaeria bacterium]